MLFLFHLGKIVDCSIKAQSLESNLAVHTLEDNEAGCAFEVLGHEGGETVEHQTITRLKKVILIIIHEGGSWFLIIFPVARNKEEKGLCSKYPTEAQIENFSGWQLQC